MHYLGIDVGSLFVGVVLVDVGGILVSADARLPNILVEEALREGRLSFFADYDDIRREAVRALRHMRAKAALPHIKRCLDDPEPTVRSAALAAVCDVGSPEDRAAAIEKLRNDPDPEVRRKVERRLQAHGEQPPPD